MHDLDQIIWFGPGRMCLWLVGIITHGLILTSATKWADYTQGPRRPIAGYSEHATLTRARPTPFQRLSSVFWMEKGFNLLGDRCVLYFKTCMNGTKLFWTWFWASSWMNIASGIVGVICRIRASIVSSCCCCCRKTVAFVWDKFNRFWRRTLAPKSTTLSLNHTMTVGSELYCLGLWCH